MEAPRNSIFAGDGVSNFSAGQVSIPIRQSEGRVAEEGEGGCVRESIVEANGERIGVGFDPGCAELDVQLGFHDIEPYNDSCSENMLALAWVVWIRHDFVPDTLDLFVISGGKVLPPDICI